MTLDPGDAWNHLDRLCDIHHGVQRIGYKKGSVPQADQHELVAAESGSELFLHGRVGRIAALPSLEPIVHGHSVDDEQGRNNRHQQEHRCEIADLHEATR